MSKTLSGKVALVTGGSRGLGVAIANALADEGADVAISYVASAEKAAAVVRQLEAKINVAGVIANIRAAAKVLPDGGRIVTIGSGAGGRAGFPGCADYAGTKAAVVGYSKGAARDLAPRNITVNVVQAGLMDTEMATEAGVAEIIFPTLAIRRFGRLEEIAAGVVFLASPAASYITGTVLNIEGGYGA